MHIVLATLNSCLCLDRRVGTAGDRYTPNNLNRSAKLFRIMHGTCEPWWEKDIRIHTLALVLCYK